MRFDHSKNSARLSMIVLAAMAATNGFSAFAEETAGEKIENKAGEIAKDTKKGARKAKRKMRNATCTDERRAAGKCGVKHDVKDSLNDAKDEVKHSADVLENKVD